MARGGYRPGSGPKKGTKYKTLKNVKESAEVTPEQKEEIRLMLAFGKRLEDGGKLTRTEMRILDKIGVELSIEGGNTDART